MRIWAKVIFTGRSAVAHDSAGQQRAQIVNPLGRGTAASYSASWVWKVTTAEAKKEIDNRGAQLKMQLLKRIRARVRSDIRQAIDGVGLFFAITIFFCLLESAHLLERIQDFVQRYVN